MSHVAYTEAVAAVAPAWNFTAVENRNGSLMLYNSTCCILNVEQFVATCRKDYAMQYATAIHTHKESYSKIEHIFLLCLSPCTVGATLSANLSSAYILSSHVFQRQ